MKLSWLGIIQTSTLETDVYVWRYALLVVLARKKKKQKKKKKKETEKNF